MHTIAAVLVAVEEIDPASVRPSPLTSVVFAFLLVAVVLLMWSFVRHLRRAQENLGPARQIPPPDARPGAAGPRGPAGPVDSGPGEGGSR